MIYTDLEGNKVDPLLGRKVKVVEYLDPGIYYRTVFGTLRRDKDGLYIEDEDIRWSAGAMSRGDDKIPESRPIRVTSAFSANISLDE